MILLAKLFEVLFPVFLIIGIGFWYGKKDPKFNTKFITTFAGNFGFTDAEPLKRDARAAEPTLVRCKNVLRRIEFSILISRNGFV